MSPKCFSMKKIDWLSILKIPYPQSQEFINIPTSKFYLSVFDGPMIEVNSSLKFNTNSYSISFTYIS